MSNKVPYSLIGREIKHRSTPAHDERIRDEPVYHRSEQLPMNHQIGPPGSGSLTPEEQVFKHKGEIIGYTSVGTPSVPLNLGRKNRAKCFVEQPPG